MFILDRICSKRDKVDMAVIPRIKAYDKDVLTAMIKSNKMNNDELAQAHDGHNVVGLDILLKYGKRKVTSARLNYTSYGPTIIALYFCFVSLKEK